MPSIDPNQVLKSLISERAGIRKFSYLVFSVFFVSTTIFGLLSNLPQENEILIVLFSTITVLTCVLFGFIKKLNRRENISFIPDGIVLLSFFVILCAVGRLSPLLISFLVIYIAIEAYTRSFFTFSSSVAAIIFFLTFSTFFINGGYSSANFINDIILPFLIILGSAIVFRTISLESNTLRTENDQLNSSLKHTLAERGEIEKLVNSISDGLISVDHEKKIKFINDTAQKLLSIEDQKLLGDKFDEIFITAHDTGKFSVLDEVMGSKDSKNYDNILLFTKNQTLKISAGAKPILDNQNQLVGATVLFKDITEEKLEEEQKAEFNAVASHELRTPLAVIDGYTFNLLNDKKLKYDAETGQNIRSIADAVKSLIQLTNNILTITQVDNHQIKINLEKVDLKNLIAEVSAEFKPKIKAQKLSYTAKIDEKLPRVLTDKSKIEEVLTNLLENALKFTEKGSITVSAVENKDHEIEVKVTDTGIGIAKKDHEKLFERFYRTENWQTRKTGGTGLGLYISKSLVKEVGGKIGVISTLGKGSTFWFTLPLTMQTPKRKTGSQKQLDELIQNI